MMARKIRSALWFGLGLYLLSNAFFRYLHPSTDPAATKGLANVMSGVVGALSIYGAYDMYRRRNSSEPANPDAISPRTMMWTWLIGATLLVFGMFWPLVWHLSLNILVRIGILAYLLFEAWEAYREKSPQSSVRAHESIGLKIIGAIVVAFGLVIIGGGLWLAESEWSKVTRWPRTSAVLIDKKISPAGARLIFEYDVAGGRTAGRVDRYGQEEEMRTFLQPYRVGASYPIGYNPENAPEVEFHLGYNWDLFRLPITIVMFGTLFALAGLVVGGPWRKAPRD
jgi:hypothetical protein